MFRKTFFIVLAVATLAAFSANAQMKPRVYDDVVSVGPAQPTKPVFITVIGPDQFGNYKVWTGVRFPVPEGVTMMWNIETSDGLIPIAGPITVTADKANQNWLGWVWGNFDSTDPLPAGTVGFSIEFTGPENFKVFAPVNASPANIQVHSNGEISLLGPFSALPVVSLKGRECGFAWNGESGWFTPPADLTGEGVNVTLCHGFPNSECRAKVTDVPSR